jgi:hypothetical protein
MGPADMLKFVEMKNRFERNHPKILNFFTREIASGIPEGTVLELTITKPGKDPVTANMRVTADDLEMLANLRNITP